MRRPKKDQVQKLSADSQRLISYAQAITQAASRIEERLWERSLDQQVIKTLKAGHQDHIDSALNDLFISDLSSYDVLMEAVEACSESCQLEIDEQGQKQSYKALLVAAPVLAWTRFSIDSGPIAHDIAQTLQSQLMAMLADDTKMALMPCLFSVDQLPRSHSDTYSMTQRMATAAIKGSQLRAPAKTEETAPFLADTRYLLFIVVARAGAPLFRWQMAAHQANYVNERAQALSQWRTQALSPLTRLLPGCGVELLLPEAYFVACREADKLVRPITIRAAIHYLTQALSLPPDEFRAVVAPFGEENADNQVEEYRIGFTLRDSDDVIYGVVWPLYGPEDEDGTLAEVLSPGNNENKTPIDEIIGLLQKEQVHRIKRHKVRFNSEYCDDCGSPLFADPGGELVHAEMPEDTPGSNEHFH
jgi:Protein of unknown function (DUF2863)